MTSNPLALYDEKGGARGSPLTEHGCAVIRFVHVFFLM
jgi:hypothetical protein